MFRHITIELKNHAPFTIFGAITGIIIMIFSHNIAYEISYRIFYILHPAHVLFSAFVTASMYRLHNRGGDKIWTLLLIGYAGSVGIATISDSVIPFMGEIMLNLPNREIHLGFIEDWWIVNPLAIFGIAIAYFRSTTKFPHSVHVLLSTWASLFHIIMALGQSISWIAYIIIFILLFFAVWIPCCFSDIVFPLLFIKGQKS